MEIGAELVVDPPQHSTLREGRGGPQVWGGGMERIHFNRPLNFPGDMQRTQNRSILTLRCMVWVLHSELHSKVLTMFSVIKSFSALVVFDRSFSILSYVSLCATIGVHGRVVLDSITAPRLCLSSSTAAKSSSKEKWILSGIQTQFRLFIVSFSWETFALTLTPTC